MTTITERLADFCDVNEMGACSSTQMSAKEYLKTRDISRPVLFNTFEQTDGVGRFKRKWWSPCGALSFTLAIPFDSKTINPRITLLAGINVSETLNSVTNASLIKIKWPNDIIAHKKKLGGILCETVVTPDKKNVLLMGFGLNINNVSENAPEHLKKELISLSEITGKSWGLETLLVKTVKSLILELERQKATPFKDFESRFRNLDAIYNKEVTIEREGAEITGTAAGIDIDGALIIDISGVRQKIISVSNLRICYL